MKLNQTTRSIVVVLAGTAAASLCALFIAPFREGPAGFRDRTILVAYIVAATIAAILLPILRRRR